jgi:hypothetical protein
MKIEDRRRQNVAISELTQALTLTKLASRGLIDLYERHPKHRPSLKQYIEVYSRWFAEEWDTLVAVTDPSERCTFDIPVEVKPTSQEIVRTVFKLEEQVQEVVLRIQQLVHENPEMVTWGEKLVSGIWHAANHSRQSYGRTQITLRHQARLEKLGKPDPVGVEVGEPTRPIEPPLRVDAEAAAWMAENPADAILPPSGPEDFVCKHGDGTVTRLRDLAPAYEAGLIDRTWAPISSNWELDLIHDLILVRASAHNVYRISDAHLNWWLKPLKSMVKTLDPDALFLTAKAQLASMMSAPSMLVTAFGNNHGGGWMLTHTGRAIVEEKLLPQWPTFNGNGGGK